MADTDYPFSVFYISQSVFEKAGKRFTNEIENKAFSFLFKAVLTNARYKKHIGTCITFTTKQIFQLVKGVDFENKFKGLMELGENMAHAEDKESIRGDKNFRLLQHANDKDTEIIGDVKVVCDDYPTTQYFIRAKQEKNYPIDVIDSEYALTELTEISDKIKSKLGF